MPSANHDTLHAGLVTLFLSAADAAARRLADVGIPLTVMVNQHAIKRERRNPNGWQSGTRQIQENMLANDSFSLYRVAPLLDSDTVTLASQCTAELVEMPGVRLPFFAPIGSTNGWMLIREASAAPASVDYAANAVDWTERHVLLPALLEHLKALPSLDAATAADAARFADEVLSFARSDQLTYRTTAPLGGVLIAASRSDGFTAHNAHLYSLSEDEQGKLLQKWGIGNIDLNPFQTLPMVALDLKTTTGRTAQNEDTREQVTKWLCALQLNGYKISGRTAQFEPVPRWFMPMSGQMPLYLPGTVHEWKTITPSAFNKIAETVELLEDFSVTQPRSAQDFALHRFSAGASRSISADAVVDFVVTLESLLLPVDRGLRHSDLAYRFRTHGAHYLAKTKRDRTEVDNQLKGLYDLRSRLVHGGRYPTPSDIEAGRSVAEELARKGLVRALSGGFPDADKFRAMVIGA